MGQNRLWVCSGIDRQKLGIQGLRWIFATRVRGIVSNGYKLYISGEIYWYKSIIGGVVGRGLRNKRYSNETKQIIDLY